MKQKSRKKFVMAGGGMGPWPEIGVLAGSAGGAMGCSARQIYINHFSAGGSLDEFVATQFSGFLRKARLSYVKFDRKLSRNNTLKRVK